MQNTKKKNTNNTQEKTIYTLKDPNKSIALIGMPGCFKSTVGKLLAKQLGLVFCDTDALYEKKHGISISETFETLGEEVFRARESVLVARAAQKKGLLISTGGGVVVREENITALKNSCVVIQLYANVYTIFARIRNSKNRPLLKDMTVYAIEELYAGRKDLYARAADFKIITDGKMPKAIAQEIIDIVCVAAENKTL